MKFKNSLIVGLIIFLFSFATFAQEAKLYTIFSGNTETVFGTNGGAGGWTNTVIIAGVTNQYGSPRAFTITVSNLMQKVYEFDNVGLTIKFNGITSTTNGNVNFKIYKSYDEGNVFELTPSFAYTFVTAGAVSYQTNGNLSVSGVTTLGISFDNESSDYITNLLLEFKPKATKVMTRTSSN
jgi:hypothetical protein